MKTKIVVLDGYALNPGDICWSPVEMHGELTVHDRSRGLVVERATGSPVVLTNKDIIGREQIEALPELKYIGVLATGTNVVDLEAARERGIVVTNVPSYGVDSVAQHTFALMLQLCESSLADHSIAVHEGEWARSPDFCFTLAPMSELAGKTLGIVGLGAIGRRVARIGSAFGMEIATVEREDRKPIKIHGVPLNYMPLDELFATADVLTLHCPLTDENAPHGERRTLGEDEANHTSD